jgi:hypothetical protein
MNIRQTQKMFSFMLSLVLIFFMACNDDNENNVTFTESEQSAYEAEESTENIFDVVESITLAAMDFSDASSGGRLAVFQNPETDCAEISITLGDEMNTVVIDFGDGCEGPDGKTRKGKVIVDYKGNWLMEESLVTTVLQDFYIDGIKVEGTRVVNSLGFENNTLTLGVQIIGGKVTWPDESFLTRTSTRTHKLIIGQSLDEIELEVTGEAAGVTREGIEYVVETVEPLLFKGSCRGNTIYLPVSGIKTITIPELPVLTVDYGAGDCDNKITVILDRGSKEITL